MRIKKFILFFGFLIFSPLVVSANGYKTGLVPCGGPGDPCTFCDFFVMFDRIVDFLLVPCIYNSYIPLVPAIGALMLAIGGFMYMFSYSGMAEGGPEQISKAKRLFSSVAIGLLIAYGAWVVVNLFFQMIGTSEWTGLKEGWWEINCDSDSGNGGNGGFDTAPPDNEGACKNRPGCFWVVSPWGTECVCSGSTDNCYDCWSDRECCNSLGGRCKWEQNERGTYICKNK